MIKCLSLKSKACRDIILIISLGFVLYFFMFFKSFHFANDFVLTDFSSWHRWENISFHRPIAFILLRLIMLIFQSNPMDFYKISMILHIFNAILGYKLCILLTKNNKISLMAAVFFLVHYISINTILCVHNFPIILSSFFLLISMISFIRSLSNVRFKSILYAVSILSYFLALGSRESVLAFPFIIIAYDFLFTDTFNYSNFKKIIYRNAPFFIITLIIIAFIICKEANSYHLFERIDIFRYNFASVIINAAIFLEALFIPFNFQWATITFWQAAHHSLFISSFVVGGIVLLGILVKDRLYKFSIILVMIYLGPYLFRPYQIKEIYLYWPLIGAGLFVSCLLCDVTGRVRMINKKKGMSIALSIGKIYFPLVIVLLLFGSSLGRVIDREKVGKISKEILTALSQAISPESKNVLIYAFWFPVDVNRFYIGNYRTKEIAPFIYRRQKNKVDWRKTWFSIDCRGGIDERIAPREGLYALTLNRKISKKIRKDLARKEDPGSGFADFTIKKIEPEIMGVDTLFPSKFVRHVFCYQKNKVFDLTDKVFPKTKVIFRVKIPQIKNIAVSGDFNEWSKKDYLSTNNEGVWEKTFLLSPGKYLYKFIINNKQEAINPDFEYSISDPEKGRCSILAIANHALPIGLLSGSDDVYDKKVTEIREKLLINPGDAALHEELSLLYRQRGFYKESALEYQIMKEIIDKGA